MDPPLWTEGASPYLHEREALAFVRTRLPNYEPYRAWSNVEFIAEDGSVNEVDLLVATPRGFFLVEIKSYPGTLWGDGQRWRVRFPSGRESYYDHPLILANAKARRLRSLLARQRPFRREQPPWVTALVFLSSDALEVQLDVIARTAVCGRDPDPASGAGPSSAPGSARSASLLPGIVATLKDPTLVHQRGAPIDKVLSAKLAEALEQAGLHPSNRGRRIGDWELGELLDDGPGWQDHLAARPRVDAKRRVRTYLAGTATTAEDQERLRKEAEREFRLVQDLRHDGIAQPLDLVQVERGPALLFDTIEGEQRLDLWAPDHVPDLAAGERVELIRQLGEAIAHAHAHKVTHRSLGARSILVRPSETGQAARLLIGHWQAGARELATTLTHLPSDTDDGSLATALTERLGAEEKVYLAPEAFSVTEPDGVALDVFSLGTLAVLLLTGQPPAADLTEREAMLAEHGALTLRAAVDEVPARLAEFVAFATDPVPARRATIRDLLELLDDALDELTAPTPAALDPDLDGDAAGSTAVDPVVAHQGGVLEGGWEVLRRLGTGSTAVALLCRRAGGAEPEVLKIAKDESHAERLREEALVLRELHAAGIVELHAVERIGGRTALRLAPAGDPEDKQGMTLADRLATQGRVGLDLLERFGDDLLEIVAYLESEGVTHRDIKPDNLGVRPRRGDRSLHLVLFDFSLARTPDTSLTAGTPGYLDPFLHERPARRWDRAAERYAVAAVLHEMATGIRPMWGDGRTDPIHLTDDEPRLDPEMFDPSVRDGLSRFFARALHRVPDRRFATTDSMRQAWRGVFAAARRPATASGEDRAADAATLERLADVADDDTPVMQLGLSGAATSALERLGVGTVRQLLDYPTIDWNRAAGVGLQVRREVLDAIGRLRSREGFDGDVPDPAASIDRLAAALVPKQTTAQAQADGPALAVLLGLPGGATSPLPLDGSPGAPGDVEWPGPADVAAACALDRAGYDALLDRARARWSKQPGMTQARHDIAGVLQRSGGVLPAEDIALAMLAQRGSTSTGPERRRRARAVVRAALETEAARETNRFTWRRLAGGASAVVALRNESLDAEALADYAANLGREADEIARTDPLPTPAAAAARLRGVPVPLGLPPLEDHRIVRLATAASAMAASSSRLEVYPRGMPADRAVRLARAALLGAGVLSEEEVRKRVQTRFPAAAPLPPRRELDELLRQTVHLEWVDEGPGPTGALVPAGFRVPPPPAATGLTAFGASGTRFSTGAMAEVPDDQRVEAQGVDERLRRHAERGGYLVLTVSVSRHHSAFQLLEGLGAHRVDLDHLIVSALRRHADDHGVRWEEGIVAADAAGPGGDRWVTLLNVVRDTMEGVRDALLTGDRHVLLTNPGLLARYGALWLLDELRERTTRQPTPGQTLRTLWVLVPAEDPDGLPTIGGGAVPVTTDAERLALPSAWLKNVHHTAPAGATP